MAHCDFAVKYDPSKDTQYDLAKKIVYALIVRKLKQNKPRIVFGVGESGSGKSMSFLTLQMMMLEAQGLKLEEYIDDINVYVPLEYPQKIKRMLFEKELKKVNIICLHEAREVLNAKLWFSFINRAIANVNAMSRGIKPLCIMIISQLAVDVSTDVRRTMNFYLKMSRPSGRNARIYINTVWIDDRDLERPKIRKRRISGYLVYPNGTWQPYRPEYLEVKMPPKHIAEHFDRKDVEAKGAITRSQMNKLMVEIQKEVGKSDSKVEVMVEWYLSHQEQMGAILQSRKGNIKLKPEFKKMHQMTDEETESFQTKLQEAMVKGGLMEKAE